MQPATTMELTPEQIRNAQHGQEIPGHGKVINVGNAGPPKRWFVIVTTEGGKRSELCTTEDGPVTVRVI